MKFLLRHALWLAPLITFVGFVSYYLVFVNIPALRDFPWVNLPLVALGAVLAIVGLVPLAAGIFNFCLLGPVFGVDLWGRSRSSGNG